MPGLEWGRLQSASIVNDTGDILQVLINCDKKSKMHQCVIEQFYK